MESVGITHILSIIEPSFIAAKVVLGFTHMVVDAVDIEDQDLLSHFNECFEFIDSCLAQDGAVLVHCQAGISRSVTVVTAYMMSKEKIPVKEALRRVRGKRVVANPNEGFLEQLELFEKMDYRFDTENQLYQRWKLEQDSKAARYSRSAPVVTQYTPLPKDNEKNASTKFLRCKKCR